MGAAVRDVMTRRVVAVTKDADFKEIVSVLRRHRVSAVPVIDSDGCVVGVVSEADLLYKEAEPCLPTGLIRLAWKLGEESKVTAITAGQLMTAPAATITPDATVVAAARLMQERQVKRLPVVGPGGKLVGIVSRVDALAVYERPDEDILAEVVGMIVVGQFGLDPRLVQVSVATGIVTLAGEVPSYEVALALVARVRHTEGVVAVRDRLALEQHAV